MAEENRLAVIGDRCVRGLPPSYRYLCVLCGTEVGAGYKAIKHLQRSHQMDEYDARTELEEACRAYEKKEA